MKNTHGASRPSKMCACVFKQWIVITPLPRLQKMPLKKENSSDSSRSHASIRLSRQFSPNYCIIHFFIQYKNSRSSHFPMSVSQWQLEGCFGCQCLRCWNCKLHDWLMTVIIVGHVFRLRSPAIKKITRSNTSQLWTHKICFCLGVFKLTSANDSFYFCWLRCFAICDYCTQMLEESNIIKSHRS